MIDMARVEVAVDDALSMLRAVGVPADFLESMRTETFWATAKAADPSRVDRTFCYLAFYGADNRASFMKVGIAKNVGKRLANIATGNPLPCLWAYQAAFINPHIARAVEARLLGHMLGDRARGEWINVHGLSESAALAMVESLAEVASDVAMVPVSFSMRT